LSKPFILNPKTDMYGLITLPLVPLRASDSEQSEMTSQLLFGEYVKILEQHEKWCFVENNLDKYTGWVNRKMISPVSDEAFLKSRQSTVTKLHRTHTVVYNAKHNHTKLLPGGSLIYDLQGEEFYVGDESWCLIEPYTFQEGKYKVHLLLETAMQYLNAPYLWGGKSVLGIDCSGFVQVVFAIAGYTLPRDASQQVEQGELVDFLSEALPGDLAFFVNETGSVVHVGILVDNKSIIHASGWVKIESFDSQGIISSETGEYTHQLGVVKRIISSL
jgi:gamma-D-glutamyl-L-lysine dipeptidyl-peptidase